jgi:ribonuclease PH
MARIDGRAFDELRPIKVTENFLAHPLSSVLLEVGGTKVICALSLEDKVPGWMKAQKVPGGWLTCEYGLLPASTHDRCKREASNGKQSGRTMEIQRLIGRSLRAVVYLDKLGENTLFMDCDVIDADGGTRCASITGASIALQLGMRNVLKRPMVLRENVAAISVGIVRGELVLDLNYDEDSNAEVDMNVVMTESGKLVEVQGTAEGKAFSRKQLNEMIDLAEFGLKKIFTIQKNIIEKAPKVHKVRQVEELGSLGDVFGNIKL